MRFRSSETGRLNGWGWAATTASAGALAVVAGCSSGRPGAAETASSSPSAAASAAALTWPGRVALANTCPTWSLTNHGPATISTAGGGKSLLVMIDARLSSPRDCDPQTDTGAGAQRGASAFSGAVPMSSAENYDGGRFIRDGVVVKVVGYTATGELTCQSDGTNPTRTWIEVQPEPNGPEAWVPVALTGYEPTPDLLAQAGIPDVPAQAQYANSVQGGC